MEMFKKDSHIGHSYTLKNFSDEHMCHEGTDWWWNKADISTDDYGARSLQFRLIQFPRLVYKPPHYA